MMTPGMHRSPSAMRAGGFGASAPAYGGYGPGMAPQGYSPQGYSPQGYSPHAYPQQYGAMGQPAYHGHGVAACGMGHPMGDPMPMGGGMSPAQRVVAGARGEAWAGSQGGMSPAHSRLHLAQRH